MLHNGDRVLEFKRFGRECECGFNESLSLEADDYNNIYITGVTKVKEENYWFVIQLYANLELKFTKMTFDNIVDNTLKEPFKIQIMKD